MLAKLTTRSIKKSLARRQRARRRGQGMTEYIIIVGLIAILLISAVTAFRDALNNTFNAATNEINSKITTPINSGG